MNSKGLRQKTGEFSSQKNIEGRGRGRGLRGSGSRGTNNGRGRGAGRETNRRNKRTNNWAVTELDSGARETTEYRDVEQIFDGFNGRTVFNQKIMKTEPNGRVRTEYRGTRRGFASRGFRGSSRGTPFRRDADSSPAKTSDFHTENTTEVYDFSNFSADDFQRPNFRGRGRGGSSRGFRGGPSTRGFQASRGRGLEKRTMIGHEGEEFGAKRSRQDSE